MAKAVSNLAFVEALVKTGAQDESEVNWSNLSLQHPRAQLKWKTLRGVRRDQPQPPNSNSNNNNNLGLQEVSDGPRVRVMDHRWIMGHGHAI